VEIVTVSVFTDCFTPEADETLTFTVPEVVKAEIPAVTTLEMVVLAVSALASEDANTGAHINAAVASPRTCLDLIFTNSPFCVFGFWRDFLVS
jgi:hypothetical protein